MSFSVNLPIKYITNLKDLCEALDLPEFWRKQGENAEKALPFKMPCSLLDRIEKGNPNDPVLLQFLPNNNELENVNGFINDPLDEENALFQPGILQKYQNRVLVLTNDFCAAQCRFCFRRTKTQSSTLFDILKETDANNSSSFHYDEALSPFPEKNIERSHLKKQENCFNRFFQALRDDLSISEIIFSGGDPLAISNEWLKNLLYYIKTIGHVKRVRFHSRLPILIPERIDETFPLCGNNLVPLETSSIQSQSSISQNSIEEESSTNETKNNSQTYYFVFHINHPNELNERVYEMFDRLLHCGVVLMSQTVLLKKINDNVSVLEKLFNNLINHRVIPYYLHQIDKVQGAAAFEVPISKGLAIMQELRKRLPGYAVPNYVQEIPGTVSKQCLENISKRENII